MTNYAATDVTSDVGTAVTERTGASSGDTVPGGATVVWRNTGAGAHVVTLTTNNLDGDLAVADRTISLSAGQVKVGKIKDKWADVDGHVQVAIDSTASEVKYLVLGL